MDPDSLLLVLPVPFRRSGATLLVESQACNGLDRWAEHFRKLVVACPVEPEEIARRRADRDAYLPTEHIRAHARIEFVPLPWAYALGPFLRTYRRTRATLAEKIRGSTYLTFGLGGLVGDWAAVASLEAIRQCRPFSVWTDRVEHEVIKRDYLDHARVKRLYRRFKNRLVVAPLMKNLHRHILTRCDLGLLHGRDCFDTYAPYCRNPHVVHNIHTKPGDHVPADALAEKLRWVAAGGPLRLVYAGRVAEMKGPLDWVRVLAALRDRGVPFHATWLGDGPRLDDARAEVVRLGLTGSVELPGHIGDRDLLLCALRAADLFVFCHKTPESPRCLIEALISGCAPVGYDSPYSRGLLESAADRLLVPRLDETGLAELVYHLHQNRDELVGLIRACATLGSKYSDVEVFRPRGELIKEYLTPTSRDIPITV